MSSVSFWKWLHDICTKKVQDAFLEKYGCDSCCPRCNMWQSAGNWITTKPSNPDDGSDIRKCHNCGNEWVTIFTPAGHVPVEQKEKSNEN